MPTSKNTNLRHAVGSLLVVGLSGPELTSLERAWLRLLRPAGVILFKRNVTDPNKPVRSSMKPPGSAPATACATSMWKVAPSIVFATHYLRLPSAQAVATAARHKPALAREFGRLIARAVRAFGFNTTLAPVVDLALPESVEVMGTRSVAPDPSHVIEFARAFMAGLADQNIIACGKHFPGLGGAASDTHFVTPEIHRTFEQLWTEDLAPYRELHKQMPIVMTNHAAYPETPGKNQPASASRFWISTRAPPAHRLSRHDFV